MVASAVDADRDDTESFSAERAAITNIASAAKISATLCSERFLASANLRVEVQIAISYFIPKVWSLGDSNP